ncbi:MAG: RHS repeat protein, partial [Betaproteobacteria bacterium]|nr:RHS repeat protein [Betaproteobacteria bacterium]
MGTLTDDEDARMSSFVMVKRVVTGKKDGSNEASQQWQYEGYDTGGIYSVMPRRSGEGQTPQKVMYFKTVKVTEPSGSQSETRFDQGLPVEGRDVMGHKRYWQWNYEDRRPVMEVSDANGFRTEKVYRDYDSYGYPQTIEESGTNTTGRVTRMTYERSPVFLEKHIVNLPSTKRVESGGKSYGSVRYEYDGNGLMRRESTEYGSTDYVYDEYGNAVSVKTPLGHVSQTDYENGIYPVGTEVLDVGFRTRTTYYPRTLLVKEQTSITGAKTSYEYDDRSRVIRQTTQTGENRSETQVRYSDDPLGLGIRMETRTGSGHQDKVIEGAFNQFSQPYRISVTAKGMAALVTNYEYDNEMNIIGITDSVGRKSRYQYDETKRITGIEAPNGSRQTVQYLDGVNAQVVEDENGHGATYMYDSGMKLIQARQANSGVARYDYTAGGLIRMTDMRGFKTEYEIRGDGKRTRADHGNGMRELWEYDAMGHVVAYTDGKGQRTSYLGYDSQGRPGVIRYVDREVEYRYDTGIKGKVDRITERRGGAEISRTDYEYDAMGNVVNETRKYDGKTVQITSRYDDTGLLMSQWNSVSNRTQSNMYDSLGRLTKVSYTINGQDQTVVDQFQYTPTNRLIGYRFPLHNIQTTLDYDPQTDRVTQWRVTGPGTYYISANRWVTPNASPMTYIAESYAYDLVGNRIKNTSVDGTNRTRVTEYGYDLVNQLVQTRTTEGGSVTDTSYEYDVCGNKITQREGDRTERYEVSKRGNQIDAMWTTAKKGDAG